jgi:perosamine synthetase
MFTYLKNYGKRHHVYHYDIEKHPFLAYFQKIFNYEELDTIHLISSEYEKYKDILDTGVLSDKETDLHKIFYKDIKTNNTFKELYCNFIKDIYAHFFPDEEIYIYQSFPSIRIQFFDSVVIPPHYDSDSIGNHPIGEKNFLIPITKMFGTNTIYIEKEPRKEDFEAIELEYGNLFMFDGNQCTHFNKMNKENKIRISLDFRIILLKDYIEYINTNKITITQPREDVRKPIRMIAGSYYQIYFKNSIHNITQNWIHNNEMILQSRPNFDQNEADACYKYMCNFNNFVTEYKQTECLEKMLCEYIGCKYCVMTTSGTAALILALLSMDIKRGDEVIVPNYTMIATINAIKFVGATPVIIDVDKDTFTISPELVLSSINENTKAIVHVSLNNRIKNIEELVNLCNTKQIRLLEDAAQSLGCFYKNKHIGTFGEVGCFSLSTPKIISTGQGGFITTNNEQIYKKLIMSKNFGRKEGGIDNFEMFGLNLKYTDIQAVIGIEQVKKLSQRVLHMQNMYKIYYDELKDYIDIREPTFDGWLPWFVDIYTEHRDELIEFLKNHNIQTRKTYPAINKTPMYFNEKIYENTNYVSDNGLFLPSHTLLNENEIYYICQIIKLFYHNLHKENRNKMDSLLSSKYDKNVYITLTSCANDKITSPFYIKNENTGLGNMLFQIASGLSYSIKHQANLNIIGLKYHLNVEEQDKSNTIFRKINDYVDPYFQNIKDSLLMTRNNEAYIFDFPFYENINFHSYFENYRNFEEIKELILYCFSPNQQDIDYIINKYPIINNKNVCSLHIRFGPDFNTLYGKDSQYIKDLENNYIKCINYMIKYKNITDFFVFTNDKNYTKELLDNYDFNDINFHYSSEKNYIDIWMISLIKNNIVSISTLSWWGSYLNRNKDKYIVCCKGNRDALHYPGWVVIE